MKKIIYTLLTSLILFTVGCEDEKKEESAIIGTWTLSAVCMFADGNCSGECSDVYEEWIEINGSFSMTFSEGGAGVLTIPVNGGEYLTTDVFNWSGSGPYTLTAEDEEPLTVTLSDSSITWNQGNSNVCYQFTLIK